MRNILDFIYKHQSLFYKGLIYFISVFIIVYLFPQGGKFNYEFQKGKPWQYESLYAPFDFTIKKSLNEIEAEKLEINKQKIAYFNVDTQVEVIVLDKFELNYQNFFELHSETTNRDILALGREMIRGLYEHGVIQSADILEKEQLYLVVDNEAKLSNINRLHKVTNLKKYIAS
jgi:hypothetical protein